MRYNKEVAKNQFKLKALGYDVGAVDGLNGVKTKKAVKAFQSSHKLWKDGIIGKKTSPKLEAEFVKEYQEKLDFLGYYDGAIDGDKGRLTKQAIIDVQKEHGLAVDMVVGAKTMAKLDKLVARKKTLLKKKGNKLGEHFTYEEFKCNCVEKGLNYCDGFPREINAQLIKNLEKVREHFGGKPIIITSGLRCQKYNDSLKGSIKYSKHVQGKAADIYIKGMTDNLQGKKEVIAYWYTLTGATYAYTNSSNMASAVHLDVK